MIKVIKDCKNPLVLVITPLLPEHEISNETRISIKSNKIYYKWISFTSNRKHAANVQAGIDTYKIEYGQLPEYLLILDRDIICGRKMIDRLHKVLFDEPKNIGFSYCSFEYKGHINIRFHASPYDIDRLQKGNYISSNSLYRTSVIDDVGGFIVEEQYHRLSDWAMWLKIYNYGYIGTPCYDTSFIAISTEKDISAGSNEEYQITKKIVQDNFIF
jgi:hypothetical protein